MKQAAVILACALALAIANAQTSDSDKTSEKKSVSSGTASVSGTTSAKSSKKGKKEVTEVKSLVVEDLVQGKGKVATKGKTIKVNYTGWLYDPQQPMSRGKQFDTSVGKEAFSFSLGAGQVIKGWDEGFENMKVGGKRKLLIPPSLGYGERGAGNVIPANATLMFEVELLDVL